MGYSCRELRRMAVPASNEETLLRWFRSHLRLLNEMPLGPSQERGDCVSSARTPKRSTAGRLC